MTLGEILKTAFSDAYSGLTFAQTVIIVLGALVCAAMICVSYRLTFRGALFSRSFCASLFTMCLITTLLIMAVRTNVYLSLGTLGALSVIRFRAAVKEPMDVAYMFLAVSAGVICGSNLLGIALPGVLFICAVLILIGRLPRLQAPYTLLVTGDPTAESAVMACITAATARRKLKSKSVMGGNMELIFEVRLKADDAFVADLSKIPGITSASLVKSATEYL